MQHQRDIACLSRAWLRCLCGCAAFQGEAACVIAGHQFQHRHAKLCRNIARFGGHTLLHDQRLGLQIGQIEVEFIRAIGGVERRGGGARANRDEGSRHFRTIRQHNRHAVIAANANAIQPCDGGGSEVAQPGIA